MGSLAVLSLSLLASSASPFVVEPYLHVRPHQGVFLGWQYAEPQNVNGTAAARSPTAAAPRPTEVVFQAPGRPDVVVKSTLRSGVHLAEVPWVCDQPRGARYFVEGMAKPVELRRVPCPRDATSVRAVFITDTQLDSNIAAVAADLLARYEPDVVIHGGDVVQRGGDAEEWRGILRALAPLTRHVPLVLAVGNHEFMGDSEGENVDRYFGVRPPHSWYRTRVGPLQLVVLDSSHANDDEVAKAQNEYVRSALKQEAPWQAVVFHHALFSRGIQHAPWVFIQDRHEELRRDLLADFEAAGVDLILNGHTHLFERSRKADIEYVVGGPAGGILGIFGGENPFSLKSTRKRSVSIVDATPERMTVTSVDLEGRELDRFEIHKDDDLRVAGVASGLSHEPHVRP